MIIEKYIRQLLFQHDCVVIPDFGGFIAKYAAATVHPIRHTFLPPSKEIAFNEMLRLNDGLLISHVAVGEQISREQAAKLVKDFAEYVRGQIWQNQKYTFEEIGTLSLNPEQKMEFEPINRINFLDAGYGLPEMSFKPIERSTYQAKVRTKDRLPVPQTADEAAETDVFRSVFRRNRQLWYALGFTSVVALSAFTGYFLFNNPNNQLSSMNPFASLINMPSEEDSTVKQAEAEHAAKKSQLATNMPKETAKPQPQDDWDVQPVTSEKPVEEKVSEEKATEAKVTKAEPKVAENNTVKATKTPAVSAPVAKNEKTAKSTRYYVIVNGFSVEENAKRFRNALVENGQKGAKILERGSNGLIKVSVADFENKADADAKVKQMHQKYPAAWVFENE
jgi:cell division protein FtsN